VFLKPGFERSSGLSCVRHLAVWAGYNGKGLRVEYTQSNTTILTSIINIMKVLTTICFGLTCGPSSGFKIRLDKLYYNAWETLGVGGVLGGIMVWFFYKRGCH